MLGKLAEVRIWIARDKNIFSQQSLSGFQKMAFRPEALFFLQRNSTIIIIKLDKNWDTTTRTFNKNWRSNIMITNDATLARTYKTREEHLQMSTKSVTTVIFFSWLITQYCAESNYRANRRWVWSISVGLPDYSWATLCFLPIFSFAQPKKMLAWNNLKFTYIFLVLCNSIMSRGNRRQKHRAAWWPIQADIVIRATKFGVAVIWGDSSALTTGRWHLGAVLAPGIRYGSAARLVGSPEQLVQPADNHPTLRTTLWSFFWTHHSLAPGMSGLPYSVFRLAVIWGFCIRYPYRYQPFSARSQ